MQVHQRYRWQGIQIITGKRKVVGKKRHEKSQANMNQKKPRRQKQTPRYPNLSNAS